jgi:hypothetical protein
MVWSERSESITNKMLPLAARVSTDPAGYCGQIIRHLPFQDSSMDTNLAATSAARKERLIALRQRKTAVETGQENGNGNGEVS